MLQSLQGNHAPENGVLVFGLFLDGASWDPHHECLNDSRPGDRFSKLPEIHFEPVQVNLPTFQLSVITLEVHLGTGVYIVFDDRKHIMKQTVYHTGSIHDMYEINLYIKLEKTDTKND